jgi:hypothetical protein
MPTVLGHFRENLRQLEHLESRRIQILAYEPTTALAAGIRLVIDDVIRREHPSLGALVPRLAATLSSRRLRRRSR